MAEVRIRHYSRSRMRPGTAAAHTPHFLLSLKLSGPTKTKSTWKRDLANSHTCAAEPGSWPCHYRINRRGVSGGRQRRVNNGCSGQVTGAWWRHQHRWFIQQACTQTHPELCGGMQACRMGRGRGRSGRPAVHVWGERSVGCETGVPTFMRRRQVGPVCSRQ